jgi:hypothetical protein
MSFEKLSSEVVPVFKFVSYSAPLTPSSLACMMTVPQVGWAIAVAR